METTRLSTLYGLSKALRLPASWLKNEAVNGRIPALIAGRRMLFNVEAVERELLDRAARGSKVEKATVGR